MNRLLSLLLLLCWLNTAQAQSLDDLIIITEEYPPLNYSELGSVRGIATDLLVEILGANGSLKGHDDIAPLPWARAYRILQRNDNILLYSMTRTEARKDLFKWVGPILGSEIVLLARKDQHIELKELADINTKKYRVGVVLDDVGAELLEARGIASRRLTPSNKGIYLIQTLARGGFDLISYDKLVSLWHIRQLGLDPDDFEVVQSLESVDYYYAFSPNVDDRLIADLQQDLDRLKASGRVDELLRHYLE